MKCWELISELKYWKLYGSTTVQTALEDQLANVFRGDMVAQKIMSQFWNEKISCVVDWQFQLQQMMCGRVPLALFWVIVTVSNNKKPKIGLNYKRNIKKNHWHVKMHRYKKRSEWELVMVNFILLFKICISFSIWVLFSLL